MATTEYIGTVVLTEHLGVDWHGHPVSFSLPVKLAAGTSVAVCDRDADITIPGQIDEDGKVWFLAELPAYKTINYDIRVADDISGEITVVEDVAAGEYRLSSGKLAMAVPVVDIQDATGVDAPAPICWISGPEGIRRGQGRWSATGKVVAVKSAVIASGPVYAEALVIYHFADGSDYAITWRLYAGASVVLAREEKTVNDAGSWLFDMYPQFAPDMAHIRQNDKGIWPLNYAEDEHLCRHIYCNHWDLYQDFKEVSFVYRRDGGTDGDAIGVFPVDGQHWENVTTNIISLDTAASPSVRYSFSLTPGRREFGLFIVPLQETSRGTISPTDGIGAYQIRNRWSFTRLNDVKDMTLLWDEPAQSILNLYAAPEQFAALTLRVKSQRDYYGELAETSALFIDDAEVIEQRKAAFFADLYWMRDNAIILGPNDGNCNPVMNRAILHLPLDLAALQMRNALTAEEEQRARAIMAFLAYFTAREDYDFARRALLPADDPDEIMSIYKGMRAENMSVDCWVGVGLIGLAFPNHPESNNWRQMSLKLFQQTMDALVAECGAWCEGWGYYRWSLHLLLHYAHVMHNSGENLFANPRFKSLLYFAVKALGPRSLAYNGKRITPGFGSYGESTNFSGCGFSYIMALAASGCIDTDSDFAGEMMWAYHEMGEGPLQDNVGLQKHDREIISLFTDYTIQPKAPELTSGGCPGFGAIMRHRHENGRETYLIARASSAWPHGHADGGSFFLYYQDSPLITEAARGTNQENFYLSMSSYAHNVICFDNKPTFQYVWPCRQKLVDFQQTDAMEYAILDCRVEQLVLGGERRRGHGDAITQPVDIRHYRHIIYIKPDLFVIYDDISNAPFPSDYRLHFYAKNIEFTGSKAYITGNHDINVEMTIVQPATPNFHTTKIGDTHSVEFKNEPNAPYLVVLNPHQTGNCQPAECKLEEGLLIVRRGEGVAKLKTENAKLKII
ncbi:MAG: heparinase II/III family protein [bacterium]